MTFPSTVDKAVLVREIVDAAQYVHIALGPGFLESVYSRALLSELRTRGFGIERERQIRIFYRAQVVGKHCLDLIVERAAVVELKANLGLVPVHVAQLRSYLQATDYPLGVLLNFGVHELQWEVLHRKL
jgi:GxxExxY protein